MGQKSRSECQDNCSCARLTFHSKAAGVAVLVAVVLAAATLTEIAFKLRFDAVLLMIGCKSNSSYIHRHCLYG